MKDAIVLTYAVGSFVAFAWVVTTRSSYIENRHVLGWTVFWPVILFVKAARGAWEVCR